MIKNYYQENMWLEVIERVRKRTKKKNKNEHKHNWGKLIDSQLKNDIENWRPSSLSKLTPMIFNKELTHLGSEASK